MVIYIRVIEKGIKKEIRILIQMSKFDSTFRILEYMFG
jgi:hypothetical protein